jgi:hypothetical protein
MVGPNTEGWPAAFLGRHFSGSDHSALRPVVPAVRLALRDLEELMAERGLRVDHSTIGRWALRYAAEL